MTRTVIKIEIPAETQRKIEKLILLPEGFPQAIKRGMDYAIAIVRGRIQRERLSGKGPYPPDEHRLGRVTGKLQESLRNEPAVITDGGRTITGEIGTNIFYAALHEYGFVKDDVVRGQGKPYKLEFPERAPVRTGVEENADFIAEEIGYEVDKLLEDATKG
jgi:hypothetical protein